MLLCCRQMGCNSDFPIRTAHIIDVVVPIVLIVLGALASNSILAMSQATAYGFIGAGSAWFIHTAILRLFNCSDGTFEVTPCNIHNRA